MIGTGRDIFGRALPGARLVLQSSDGAFEVENLPERDAEIQKSDTADRAAHPTRSDHRLQTHNACLAGRIQQKVVVTPIADSPHAVRPPRRHRQKDSNLEAQNDVKNYFLLYAARKTGIVGLQAVVA